MLRVTSLLVTVIVVLGSEVVAVTNACSSTTDTPAPDAKVLFYYYLASTQLSILAGIVH